MRWIFSLKIWRKRSFQQILHFMTYWTSVRQHSVHDVWKDGWNNLYNHGNNFKKDSTLLNTLLKIKALRTSFKTSLNDFQICKKCFIFFIVSNLVKDTNVKYPILSNFIRSLHAYMISYRTFRTREYMINLLKEFINHLKQIIVLYKNCWKWSINVLTWVLTEFLNLW